MVRVLDLDVRVKMLLIKAGRSPTAECQPINAEGVMVLERNKEEW